MTLQQLRLLMHVCSFTGRIKALALFLYMNGLVYLALFFLRLHLYSLVWIVLELESRSWKGLVLSGKCPGHVVMLVNASERMQS